MSLNNSLIDNISDVINAIKNRLLRLEIIVNNAKRTEVLFGAVEQNVDFINLQEAIHFVSERGGGVVFVKNGIHEFDDNIFLEPNVILRGETQGGAILDFQGLEKGIVAEGSDSYTDGTASVVNGSDIVTGSGTDWDASMEGQVLFIGGLALQVIAVNSTTELQIEVPYDSTSKSGVVYAIATPITSVSIENMTIVGSEHPGGAIFFKYAFLCDQSNLVIAECNIGLGYDFCSAVRSVRWDVFFCNVGANVTNSGAWTFNDFVVFACDEGLVFNRFRGVSVSNFFISSCNNEAIILADCDDFGLIDFAIYSNGSHGLSISNSFFLDILSGNIKHNGGDGIRFISNADLNAASFITTHDNAGFGINIANANCNNNTVTNTFHDTNTSGAINNSGTSTLLDNNQSV